MAERKRVSYLVTPLLQIVRWTLADDYQDGQLGRRKDEGGRITGDTLISSFILHPSSIRSGQTPDLPATHAVVATVAPFPAWRGSQD